MGGMGSDILNGDTVKVDGKDSGAIGEFKWYLDTLREFRPRLEAANIHFDPGWIEHGVPADKDGIWYWKAYHKEDDINFGALEADADTLSDTGQNAQTAQDDLFKQTGQIHQHWDDGATAQALEEALRDKDKTDQDLDHLRQRAKDIRDVAQHIKDTLEEKRKTASAIVDGLINTALKNNRDDFRLRLQTGCDALEGFSKKDSGGSLPILQTYAHHGAPGDNWHLPQIQDDLQKVVAAAFGQACFSLDHGAVQLDSNRPAQVTSDPGGLNQTVEQHIRDQYSLLLKAIGAGEGPKPPTKMDATKLHNIFPTLPDDKLEEYADKLNKAFAAAGLDTPERQAAFLATCAVESGELKFMKELRDEQSCTEMYGPEYQGKTFTCSTPRDSETFPTPAMCANDPTSAYTNMSGHATPGSGRNGNIDSGDGYRYLGRGPFQLTGRQNYKEAGEALGLPLEQHPEMVEVPEIGFRVAIWYYNTHHTSDGRTMNEAIDQGDFMAVCRAVNGGDTGAGERMQYYKHAVEVLSE